MTSAGCLRPGGETMVHHRQRGTKMILGPPSSPVVMIYRAGQYMMKIAESDSTPETLGILQFCKLWRPMMRVILWAESLVVKDLKTQHWVSLLEGLTASHMKCAFNWQIQSLFGRSLNTGNLGLVIWMCVLLGKGCDADGCHIWFNIWPAPVVWICWSLLLWESVQNSSTLTQVFSLVSFIIN